MEKYIHGKEYLPLFVSSFRMTQYFKAKQFRKISQVSIPNNQMIQFCMRY